MRLPIGSVPPSGCCSRRPPLKKRTRHRVGFDHLGPAEHRQRGEIGDRGAHFVGGQTLGDVDHGQRRRAFARAAAEVVELARRDTPRWRRADASSPDGRGRSADGSRCRRAPSCRCRARRPAAFADARPETSPADASDRRSVSACRPWCCRRHAWAGRHRAAASPCPAGRVETPSRDGRQPPPRPEAMPAMQARRHTHEFPPSRPRACDYVSLTIRMIPEKSLPALPPPT